MSNFKRLWTEFIEDKSYARECIQLVNKRNDGLEHLTNATDEDIEEHIGDIIHAYITLFLD